MGKFFKVWRQIKPLVVGITAKWESKGQTERHTHAENERNQRKTDKLKKNKTIKNRICIDYRDFVARSIPEFRGGCDAHNRLRYLSTHLKFSVLQNCKNITSRWKIIFHHLLRCQIPLSNLQHSKSILTDQQKGKGIVITLTNGNQMECANQLNHDQCLSFLSFLS